MTVSKEELPKRHRHNVGLLVGLIVFAVLLFGLLAFSLNGSAVWSATVDELGSNESLKGHRVRIEGTLVAGTLVKRDEPCEYRFRLKGIKSFVEVHYPQCVIPDAVRDVPGGVVKVTVEGEYVGDGLFEASQVLGKCPSKYEGRQ